MNKLPFVWELKHKGVVSHAIGSPHGLMISADRYVQDILNRLENKCAVLGESNAFEHQAIDSAIVDIARAQKITYRSISTKEEKENFYEHYYPRICNKSAIESFRKGDEAALKEAYGKPELSIDLINTDIAERSWRWIAKVPSLIVANLAHFIVDTSLLQIYEEKGIKTKRNQ
jgi:hypothetical protein